MFLCIDSLVSAQEKDSVKITKVSDNKFSGLTIKSYHQYSMDDKKPKVVYPHSQEVMVEIDGRITNSNSFRLINPDNIESINYYTSNDEKGLNCYVIKTKADVKQNIITLSELITKHYKKIYERIMFSIDGEMINETPGNILIDEKYLMKIEISSLGKVNNDGTVYFKLLTRTTKNVQEANTIYIR